MCTSPRSAESFARREAVHPAREVSVTSSRYVATVARRLAELVDDGDAQGEHGDRPELRAGGSGECGECGDCADRARDDADDAAEPTAGEQRERGDDLDLLP
jgi:hypothetical protein